MYGAVHPLYTQCAMVLNYALGSNHFRFVARSRMHDAYLHITRTLSWDGAAGLTIRSSNLGRGNSCMTSPKRRLRPWGPPGVSFFGYWGLYRVKVVGT